MHILLVNTRHFHGGGDSTYNFKLADLLRGKGHQVAFFAMQDERNVPDPNSDLFVSNIDFRTMNRHKSLVNGIRVLTRSIYSAEARNKFARLIDRVQPDVIHLQNIHGHITPSVIFEAKKRGLPVVWTLHDYKLICPNTHLLLDATGQICGACGMGKYYQPIFKRCKKGSLLASLMASLEAYAHRWMRVCDRVDYFLAPSNFLAGKLIDRGFDRQKVIHLPLFLLEDQFEPHYENQGYFLYLGKIDPIKGITTLVKAARQVPEARIILAGSVEDEVKNQLLGDLPDNVKYLGMKRGDELKALLYSAKAVVLPSIWYENQPFAILEAFAAGKPVITSSLGGMQELIGENEHGLLISPGDAQELARAMRWVQDHSEECKTIGGNAFRYVQQFHSEKIHYQKIYQLYTMLTSPVRHG